MLKATAVIRDDIKASAKVDGKIKASVRFPSIQVPKISEQLVYNVSELWSGQTISYHIGDEAWRMQHGDFDPVLPDDGIAYKFQQLDTTDANPFFKLKFSNKYGNHDRFTDLHGGQDYNEIMPSPFAGAPGNYRLRLVIDNLYNYAYLMPSQGKNYHYSFLDVISQGPTLNAFGLVGWTAAGVKEIMSLSRTSMKINLDYPPLNFNRSFGGVTITSTFSSGRPYNLVQTNDNSLQNINNGYFEYSPYNPLLIKNLSL